MSGMEMMFKAMGLDPSAIMQSAEDFKTGLQKLNADLDTIKTQQAKMLDMLSVLVSEKEDVDFHFGGHEIAAHG